MTNSTALAIASGSIPDVPMVAPISARISGSVMESPNSVRTTPGEIAVVFSVPSTHQTLQLKARQATQRPATEEDLPVLQAYLRSMEEEVGRVGYGPPYVAAMLAAPLHDVVAVSFRPETAFDQTPGPRAGAALPPQP